MYNTYEEDIAEGFFQKKEDAVEYTIKQTKEELEEEMFVVDRLKKEIDLLEEYLSEKKVDE